MRKMVLLLFASVFLFVSLGHAEIKAKALSLTPFIGGYTFEGNEDLKTGPVFGLRLGYDITRNWGVEGIFDYVPTESDSTGIDAEVFGYRVEALYNFMPEKKLVPFLAVGLGGRSLRYDNTLNDRNHMLVDYGAGLKYFLTDNLALRGDIRHLITINDTYNNLEYTIGLTYFFGGEKKAARVEPAAAAAAEPATAPPVQPALMAPINLTARAVSDSQTNLNWNPVSGAVGYKIYRDGSYIASSETPTAPDKGLQADTRYCYRVTAIDGNGRESVQSNEDCVTTPAPAPVVMEQKKEAAAAAEVAKEMFEKGRARINIEFDFDKAVVKDKYYNEIKKFADVMKNYPDLKVVIEGHTDSIGGKEYNQKLSEKRATNVKDYMIKKFGIEGSRLTAIGYGMSKPIDSNKTAKGRQKNRRVEAAVDYTIKK